MLALACIAAAGLASEGRMLTLGSSALKGASELKFFGEAFEDAMQDIEFEKRCGIATDAPPAAKPTNEEATNAEPYDVPRNTVSTALAAAAHSRTADAPTRRRPISPPLESRFSKL